MHYTNLTRTKIVTNTRSKTTTDNPATSHINLNLILLGLRPGKLNALVI